MSLSIKSPQLILWHSAFIILASIKLFTDIWNPAPIRREQNSDFILKNMAQIHPRNFYLFLARLSFLTWEYNLKYSTFICNTSSTLWLQTYKTAHHEQFLCQINIFIHSIYLISCQYILACYWLEYPYTACSLQLDSHRGGS